MVPVIIINNYNKLLLQVLFYITTLFNIKATINTQYLNFYLISFLIKLLDTFLNIF